MHNICFMDHSLVAVFTLLLFATLSSTDQGMELIKPHVKLAEAITCLILEPYRFRQFRLQSGHFE